MLVDRLTRAVDESGAGVEPVLTMLNRESKPTDKESRINDIANVCVFCSGGGGEGFERGDAVLVLFVCVLCVRGIAVSMYITFWCVGEELTSNSFDR